MVPLGVRVSLAREKHMNRFTRTRWLPVTVVAIMTLTVAGYIAQGASDSDLTTLQSDKVALQQQLAAMAPVQVVQAGQLAVPSPAAQPSGWETAEAIRGRIRLLATYDSSGPDAWSAAEHPLVYFTSEGVETRPMKSGVQVIDAYEKKVIKSALFDLGEEVTENPHSVGVSP